MTTISLPGASGRVIPVSVWYATFRLFDFEPVGYLLEGTASVPEDPLNSSEGKNLGVFNIGVFGGAGRTVGSVTSEVVLRPPVLYGKNRKGLDRELQC